MSRQLPLALMMRGGCDPINIVSEVYDNKYLAKSDEMFKYIKGLSVGDEVACEATINGETRRVVVVRDDADDIELDDGIHQAYPLLYNNTRVIIAIEPSYNEYNIGCLGLYNITVYPCQDTSDWEAEDNLIINPNIQ